MAGASIAGHLSWSDRTACHRSTLKTGPDAGERVTQWIRYLSPGKFQPVKQRLISAILGLPFPVKRISMRSLFLIDAIRREEDHAP